MKNFNLIKREQNRGFSENALVDVQQGSSVHENYFTKIEGWL